jgi:hypothetical protein
MGSVRPWRRSRGAITVTRHVDMVDDSAGQGIWVISDDLIFPPGHPWSGGQLRRLGYGHYQEEYRKSDSAWGIARVEQTRLSVWRCRLEVPVERSSRRLRRSHKELMRLRIGAVLPQTEMEAGVDARLARLAAVRKALDPVVAYGFVSHSALTWRAQGTRLAGPQVTCWFGGRISEHSSTHRRPRCRCHRGHYQRRASPRGSSGRARRPVVSER